MMNRSLEKVHVSGSLRTCDESETLISSMKQIENELEGITTRTEREFLSIGEKFSAFHRRAMRISEASARVAAQMTGLEIVGAIDRLNGLMARMESYLDCSVNETKTRADQLREILGLIEVMFKHLEDFRRLAKTFRAISVTGGILYASILTKNKELKVLFDGVREFSGIIAVRVESIINCVTSVRGALDESLLKLTHFEEKQRGKARSILDSTTSVLCAITEKYGFSTAIVRHIADRSGEITCRTGDIVTSVQLHDITCQKFDGVRNTLRYFSESSLAFPGGQTYVRVHNNMPANVLPGLVDCCRQQAFELDGIRSTFADAVNGITGNLIHISDNIANISSDIKKIACHGDADRQTFLAEMEDMLSSMTESVDALTENARASRDLSSTILFISSSIIEMAKFIAEIDEIADDMKLIAFNAEIKASQIGDNGASFDVIALRISGQSAETCVHTEAISEVLMKIASLSEDLSAGITVYLENADGEIEGISAEIGGLINSLSTVNSNICSCFTDIDEAGCSLSADMVSFAKSIRVHTVVDAIVNRAIDGLNDIVAYSGLQISGNMKNGSSWHGYAMNVLPFYPNDAKGRHIPANDLMLADEVKLKSDRSLSPGGPPGPGPDDLGENVELF